MSNILLRHLNIALRYPPVERTDGTTLVKSLSLMPKLEANHTKNKVIVRDFSYGLRTDLLDMTIIATSS